MTGKIYQQGMEPDYSLEDTASQAMRGVQVPGSSSSAGYNPYDTFPSIGTATGIHRQADLRKLSEWIRRKRDIDRKKKDDGKKD
jgi:hypothetical protein